MIGSAGSNATLPQDFGIRGGEDVIVVEVFVDDAPFFGGALT